MPIRERCYHKEHLSMGFILLDDGQPKAFENSSEFESVASTLKIIFVTRYKDLLINISSKNFRLKMLRSIYHAMNPYLYFPGACTAVLSLDRSASGRVDPHQTCEILPNILYYIGAGMRINKVSFLQITRWFNKFYFTVPGQN